MNQVMNVEFLNNDIVKISYNGKDVTDKKENLLNSFKNEIVEKGYVVGNDIHRQDVGDFIYYQFYYFDGTSSRNIWFQVPKIDYKSIRYIDQLLVKQEEIPEIIFDEENKNSILKN